MRPLPTSSRSAPTVEVAQNVLAYPLFLAEPSRDDVVRAVHSVKAASAIDDAEDVICVEFGPVTVFVSILGAPIPDREAEYFCHPQFLKDGLPAEQQASAIIAAQTQGDGAPSDPRKAQIQRMKAHARVLAAIAGLPECIGVYVGSAATTLPAHLVTEVLAGDPVYSMVYSPIWLVPKGSRGDAYSVGLKAMGHAEIQAVDIDATDESTLNYLADIAQYIITGATIVAGESLQRPMEKKHSTTWEPWVGDEGATALQIDL
ncbi:MAG: hypothetical protein Q4C87_06780 [Actinomycetaceae bacterium]|nr:hypothetical protein [Actinomycetaceae bacterium]